MSVQTNLPVGSLNCKTQRIRDELHSGEIPSKMMGILSAIIIYVLIRYSKHIELTDIFRTEAEQRAIYPTKPKRKSVHQYWRGVDFVVRGLTQEQCKSICKWINKTFKYGKVPYKTCKYHRIIGNASHFHLQVKAE